MDAIAHAKTIIGWYENLMEGEIPPEWMWHLPEELNEHFDKVRANRKAGKTPVEEEEIDGPVIQNEYARGRGRNPR